MNSFWSVDKPEYRFDFAWFCNDKLISIEPEDRWYDDVVERETEEKKREADQDLSRNIALSTRIAAFLTSSRCTVLKIKHGFVQVRKTGDVNAADPMRRRNNFSQLLFL